MSNQDPVRSGDVEITRMALRGGGWIGYSPDAVYLDRGEDERVQIPNDAIQEVGLYAFEWDVIVMSLLLVGVGGYVVATRNPLVGVAFAALGVFSLYRTYRNRYELVIRVENRPKPVTVHPEHPIECQQTLADHLGMNVTT